MRLQVFLSKAGIASRRAAIDIIESGRVTVNGKRIIEPSHKIKPGDDIVLLDGRKILPKKKLYVILNKPKGVTTTKKDRFAARTVIDLLPQALRHLNPAGRLDKGTRGLILLTNDGDLINRVTHPRFNIDKIYEATLDRRLLDRDKERIERGVLLNGKRTAPCAITLKEKNRLEITLHEGRKRQVRRMFAVSGYRVLELKRIKEDFLSLDGLREGEWRYLTEREVARIGGSP